MHLSFRNTSFCPSRHEVAGLGLRESGEEEVELGYERGPGRDGFR